MIWMIVGCRPLCIGHHVVWSFQMHEKTIMISTHMSFGSPFSVLLHTHQSTRGMLTCCTQSSSPQILTVHNHTSWGNHTTQKEVLRRL
jgi:predicted metal-dependent enzyme (double-stranded beta helix superfamily)